MSERIGQFCDDLKVRLIGIESQLGQVKDQLLSVSKDTEEMIRTKLDDAKEAQRAQRLDAAVSSRSMNPCY